MWYSKLIVFKYKYYINNKYKLSRPLYHGDFVCKNPNSDPPSQKKKKKKKVNNACISLNT